MVIFTHKVLNVKVLTLFFVSGLVLRQNVSRCHLFKFAILYYVDDTKLPMSFQVQDCEPTMAAMNDDLIKLRNWCFNNRLLLNPDKTKLIVYGSRQMISKLQDFRLTLLGKELLPVDSVKDLGVVFDSKLSFNDHIIKTASSCMSALGQISRVKHIFRKDILVTIINSLVFSKLYYCSSVWSNTSASNIRKLQGVQNFAARIVSGTRKFDHVSPALKDLIIKFVLYCIVLNTVETYNQHACFLTKFAYVNSTRSKPSLPYLSTTFVSKILLDTAEGSVNLKDKRPTNVL